MDTFDVQKEIYDYKQESGFDMMDIESAFLRLYGKVNETYESSLAYRKALGKCMSDDTLRRDENALNALNIMSKNVGADIADIAMECLVISEMFGYNLGKEIDKKITMNRYAGT